MSAALQGQLADLERRCDEEGTALFDMFAAARDEGRADSTPTEHRAMKEYKALVARRDELRAEVERAGDTSALTRAINAPKETRAMTTPTANRAADANLVYRAADKRVSWVQDLLRAQLGMDDTYEARNRLRAHSEQVAQHPAYTEYRDISRVDGQGGYGVPPAWLMDQYVDLARPGRAFANLCQRQQLPGGTDSINIPKLLTGTETGIQTADLATVVEQDLTDTFINAPVRTIAGQQGVAIQLLDQSPIAFDDVVFRDLIADYATKTDLQVLNGNGTGGQVLGVNHTPGISTVAVASQDVQGIYSALANAIQTIHTTRFMPPDVIVCHPRRWGFLLSLLDPQDRPLFLPYASNPMNAAGILSAVDSQQIVGQVLGLPVVTDPNITVTAGSESGGGTEDVMYVMRSSDLLLWESGLKARVLPELRAQTLSVVLQVFGYLAFSAARYPQSVCTITNLPTPTF